MMSSVVQLAGWPLSPAGDRSEESDYATFTILAWQLLYRMLKDQENFSSGEEHVCTSGPTARVFAPDKI